MSNLEKPLVGIAYLSEAFSWVERCVHSVLSFVLRNSLTLRPALSLEFARLTIAGRIAVFAYYYLVVRATGKRFITVVSERVRRKV
jgi:nucleoid-associated protein YejK